MDRDAFIRDRRALSESRMDTIFAPIYDQDWGAYINPSHQRFVERFLELLPPQGKVLDAPCGTGKYWPLILGSGRTVMGCDQSAGMLRQATAKAPDVHVEHIGLQELPYTDAFDGIACVDAMENIFPEDWPRVLQNFWRALKSGGYLYLTVEQASQEELRHAFEAGQSLGFPVVWGEHVHHGGYHYYPADEQVHQWLAEAGFHIIEQALGDDYLHILCLRAAAGQQAG